MKRIIVKAIIAFLIIGVIRAVLFSFAVPLDNNMALLQLEDSNSALALYTAYERYGLYIQYSLSALVLLIVFFKDIKKLLGGNANEKTE